VWRWELEQREAWVLIDRGQIEQALLNVVTNAIEAVAGEGTITLRVGSRGGRTAVAIEDSGPGISGEAQANLFTPFFSTKPHGQGIGLTLVQEILAGHGFEYTLERTSEASTRFTVLMR
jgi:two-component system nitrogen regulation sensor histidine kinase NtrY